MMSSKDPGTLGYYGFRNRADRSYEKMTTATSLAVKEPLLWDHLGRAGKKVILLGVPQTYPPSAGQRPDGDRLPHAVDRLELHPSPER